MHEHERDDTQIPVEAYDDGLVPEDEASPPDEARAQARQEREARQHELEETERAGRRHLEELRGTLGRIRFHGEDFFLIATLRVAGIEDPVPVKGSLAGASEWDEVLLRGAWKTDPRFGRQFDFVEGEVLLPGDEKGVVAFLSAHLPAVGPGRARAIVERFGRGADGVEGVWQVLEQAPERLAEVDGITPETATACGEDYRVCRSLRAHEVWLRQLAVPGLGPKRILKLLAKYQGETRVRLEANPYQVMEDVAGFGFKLTDEVARHIGVAPDHPGRARAALQYVLQEAAEGEGHIYLPQSELLARTDELGIPSVRALDLIEQLTLDGRIAVDGEMGPGRRVALASLWRAEQQIASEIYSRLQVLRGGEAPQPSGEGIRGPEFDPDPSERVCKARRAKTDKSAESGVVMPFDAVIIARAIG